MAQTTLHDYLQQTEHAISAERLDDALEHCQHLLNQFPDALEAQRLLGKVYLAQGYLEEAQQTFDWVLTNDPENVLAYCDRAALSERMSDVDTALDCYQQAYELSRGDGRIRREFNQLSARAGQAGFMFSRAGLARLYMRGDLLAEAIQEWEIVLASSPERLDARLGLMETCWHEGKYERTEQLARQIMQDVPGSLKALLLLAFFAAPKNMPEASRLVQKAEALDPELLLAHELFKDIKASQPDHPFLQFLKKGPVYITDQAVKNESAVSAEVDKANDVLVAANTLPQWGDMKNWNGIDTLDNSQLPAPAEALNQIKSTLNGAHSDGEQNGLPTATPLQSYAYETSDSSDSWERLPNDNASYTTNSWTSPVEEKQASAPPSWLNMLTQSEPQQVAETGVKVPEQREETAVVEPYTASARSESEGEEYQQLGYTPVLQEPAQTSDEDEEESFFGPEWLKSLGAASFSGVSPSVEMPAVSATAPTEAATQPPSASPVEAKPKPAVVPQPAFERWQTSMAQPGVTIEPWLASFEQSNPYEAIEEGQVEQTASEHPTHTIATPEAAATADAKGTADELLLNSLQGLETELHSQGFVPLEPNTLSVIAKDKQEVQSTEPAQAMLGEKPEEAEPTLFAALAEFGSLEPPAASSAAISQQSEQRERDHATPPENEPSWLASFRMTPAPEPTVPQQLPVTRKTTTPLQPAAAAMPPVRQQASQQVETTPVPEQMAGSKQPAQEIPALLPAPVPPARVDALPGPVFTPTYEPDISSKKLPEPVKVPSARSDIGFGSDLELETTMKRPAIHLQAMQAQRNTAFPAEQPGSAQRIRAGERSVVGKPTDANLNYRDRLVKGYQHQLIGEYDEAMQDYRVIVRNAPELLGEVVSNLRALLKLAPKYSAGYRVLGDAYMRQGEYLQAMESYNKALTVAKKAKS